MDKTGGSCTHKRQILQTFLLLKQYVRGAPFYKISSRFIPPGACFQHSDVLAARQEWEQPWQPLTLRSELKRRISSDRGGDFV